MQLSFNNDQRVENAESRITETNLERPSSGNKANPAPKFSTHLSDVLLFMNLIKVLDRPIAFQRVFVEFTKSITGALLLSQAVYWQNRTESEDGWWWKTQEEWEKETGMSRRELESARKSCGKVLKFERRGIPAKGYYKIDVEELAKAVGTVQTTLAETANLQGAKEPNTSGRKSQTTIQETTSETTPKNTELHEAIALWIQAHNKHSQTPYASTVAKRWKADQAAMRELLKSGRSSSALGELADKMFEAAATGDEKKYWRCCHCHTIEKFCVDINSIEAELKVKANGSLRSMTTDELASDLAERKKYGSTW